MKRWVCLLLSAAFLLAGCGDPAASKTPEAPAEPAQIKVMSWNLLNPAWGGPPVDTRDDQMGATLNQYKPDVIGLQEVSSAWHDSIDVYFSVVTYNTVAYQAVCDKTAAGKDNMTMFLYNPLTLTLIESGIEDLDAGSNIRVVSWAVFEAKNGTRFLITNTHPDSREEQCNAHTAQYLDIARRLYEEKGLPIISVGDFNAIESSDAYALSISDGYTDSKYADGVQLIKDLDSYLLGDYGGKVTRGQGSRDHIFFKGDVTPLTFETVYNETVAMVSDHLPVVAELKIG